MTVRILTGDCREVLPTLPEQSVQCCVTSPPYFGLRDYGIDGQIGLESTVEAYVAEMVRVFREVRRVLRDDGVLWLNLGDSYAGGKGGFSPLGKPNLSRHGESSVNPKASVALYGSAPTPEGLKPKDMIGIPWRVAFALQADGWWLRSDCIWSKPNAMPESVRDRPTKAHEYVFLLTKSERYFYDAEAVKEAAIHGGRIVSYDGTQKNSSAGDEVNDLRTLMGNGTPRDILVSDRRNLRTVWTIATRPFKEAHFATFPPDLAEICIKSGSRPGDTVLDPFGGAGTTGLVADRLGRDAVLIELNPEYAEMARRRIVGDAPLLAGVE